MDGPVLWYLNRSTGVVLLVLLTLTLVLGMLASTGRAGGRLPAFVTQDLHRNLGLLGVVALVVHVGTAVADTFVDIRWWQALVPYGATYEPLWFELGVVALDLMLLVVGTSLLRTRMSPRGWRAVHLTAYAAWALSVAHAWGIGTDMSSGSWGRPLAAGCVTVVAVAAIWRCRVLLPAGGTTREGVAR